MKSRGSGKFITYLIFFFSEIVIMSHRRFMSRESLKLIWMHAEGDVMKSCFIVRSVKSAISFIRL